MCGQNEGSGHWPGLISLYCLLVISLGAAENILEISSHIWSPGIAVFYELTLLLRFTRWETDLFYMEQHRSRLALYEKGNLDWKITNILLQKYSVCTQLKY